MADLSCNFVGVRSPNPFWLASAPPTDKAYNVVRAFEQGWGGVVWKTLGEDPQYDAEQGASTGETVYECDRAWRVDSGDGEAQHARSSIRRRDARDGRHASRSTAQQCGNAGRD